jgi:hypothetical protein
VDKSKMKQWLGLGTADPTELNLRDAAALFAKEAVAEWMQDLQDLVGNASLCDYFKLPETVMAAFVKELIAAAKRLHIEERITEVVRQATGFRLRFQQSVMLPARLTANLINNYLNFLGYDTISLDERPLVEVETGLRPIFRPRVVPRHGPVLSEQQSNYDQDYYTDWIRGFLDLVERNARFQGGVEVDIEANGRLEELLEQLNATVL